MVALHEYGVIGHPRHPLGRQIRGRAQSLGRCAKGSEGLEERLMKGRQALCLSTSTSLSMSLALSFARRPLAGGRVDSGYKCSHGAERAGSGEPAATAE